jgi:hypothetical protein
MALYHWLGAAIILACVSAAQASSDPVEFLGDYADVRSAAGEHCEGYDVMLWKYEGTLVGFLNHHRGLCGDPPMGAVEVVLYSSQTGSLSFNTKLSDGCTFQAGKCIPTRDRVEFKGNLSGEVLAGVIAWSRKDKLRPADSENVRLIKDPKRSRTQSHETLADWMKYWEPILKARGPQW